MNLLTEILSRYPNPFCHKLNVGLLVGNVNPLEVKLNKGDN